VIGAPLPAVATPGARAASTTPALAAAAVIGVPDDTWAERVHAVVVSAAGTTVTPGEGPRRPPTGRTGRYGPAMRFGPPVSFTHTPSGSRVAYQVLGDGDLDLVFLLGWPGHLALMWENPAFADFLEGLAAFSRLILFDRLGTGMSDRGPTGRAFEDSMDDVRTVLEAVGSQRTAFFGCHLGGRLALLFAATHPDQTSAVVTFGSHPTTLRDPDYPWGTTAEDRERLLVAFRAGTLDPAGLVAGLAPSESTDVFRRWWSTFFMSAATPPESIDEITSFGPVDIRGLLSAVHTPTLVLHRTGDRVADVAASRYMAARLPQGRFVELPGEDHLPFAGDQESVLAVTREFLTGTEGMTAPDRALLTVLFTDIVGSTQVAGRLGDRRWRLLLERHDEVVREVLGRFGGREIDTAGDGFLASFDGPARAIRAAAALRAGLAEHGIPVRAGLHTGEVELAGDKIRGIAVHVGARVVALAAESEILCSRTVKDLVAGSGFRFSDRGTHRLKGVPDTWQLYAVEPDSPY
jgi:class 3 adenylate cyclase